MTMLKVMAVTILVGLPVAAYAQATLEQTPEVKRVQTEMPADTGSQLNAHHRQSDSGDAGQHNRGCADAHQAEGGHDTSGHH